MPAPPDPAPPDPAPDPALLRRLRFRAWHRGTREMDYMLGCFFDRFHPGWSGPDCAWFAALLDADDPDVLDWVMGAALPPEPLRGRWMEALRRLDYVEIPR